MKAAIENRDRLGADRYRILHYERLTRSVEYEMSMIAAWAGIPFDVALTRPTINGQPFVSNTMFRERQSRGIVLDESADDRNKRVRSVLGADTDRAWGILEPVAEPFGYSDSPPS